MGVDYYNCSVCEEIFSDAGYYGYCIECEGMMCGHCHDKMTKKYGQIGEDHEKVGWYGGDATNKCDACDKPTLNNENFSRLMYALTKNAASSSFVDFLEVWDISQEDYDQIKKYLEHTYGTKTYV